MLLTNALGLTNGSGISKFQTQRDRSECVMARLLVELAGSPNAHDGEPHATSSNDPLAADAESCLRPKAAG